MKIKIVKCSDKELWYSKLVGQEMRADQRMGGCMARHTIRNEFNNYTLTGWIEPGDFQEVKNGKESE